MTAPIAYIVGDIIWKGLEALEQMLTMQEAKDLLRVSYRTIHRLVLNNTIPSVKVGRVIRIPQSGLEQFIHIGMSGRTHNDYQQ